METRGPLSGNIPVSSARPDAVSSAWQVGQILRGTVLSSSPGGQALLQVGTQTLQGQSPIPLTAGQTVSLQVEGLTPLPQLRILPTPGADPVGDAIRTLLPKQGSLAPLLNNLAQLGNVRPTVLPPLVQELSRSLLRQLPDTRSVSTAPGLRQAVSRSGLFLEARLLTARDSGRVNLNADLKGNLMRLVQLVRNWPGVSGDSSRGAPGATRGPASGMAPPLPLPPSASSPPPGQVTTPLPPLATPPLPTPATAPPLPPGTSIQPAPGSPSGQAPAAGQALGGTDSAAPATLARGLRAATPLPAGAAPSSGPPANPTAVPASALARVLLTSGQPVPLPPPPPLRGQPPHPQTRGAASLQAQQPAPLLRAELLQQAEASVARLQLSQLASLPQSRDTGLEWLLDLPVRRGEETDVWSLGIRRDEPQGSRDQERQGPLWTVQLAFDLPGLGPMQARVSLRGQQVSTWFWATREDTMPLLQDHLQELRRELEASGLQVAQLHCLRGSMPGNPEAAATRDPILDERV
ncbi:MAG TPA: flagellar hook-length control protein FliK [Gammaproteobacteria bacterium]|nr:flagellar hook-length control protein FliK [Gammaproteobacteria bacterium]